MTTKYLIDANLPYRFSLWATSTYLHVRDLNEEWTDTQIWEYAKSQQLIIITKDADFSDRMLLSNQPTTAGYSFETRKFEDERTSYDPFQNLA